MLRTVDRFLNGQQGSCGEGNHLLRSLDGRFWAVPNKTNVNALVVEAMVIYSSTLSSRLQAVGAEEPVPERSLFLGSVTPGPTSG